MKVTVSIVCVSNTLILTHAKKNSKHIAVLNKYDHPCILFCNTLRDCISLTLKYLYFRK